MLCEYGCGEIAQFETKGGRNICAKSANSCPVNKAKNREACARSHASGDRKPSSFAYSELPQKTKDAMAWSRGKLLTEKGLTKNSTLSNGAVKKYAIAQELLKEECYGCGLTDWLSKPIKLELDHKNGDNTDNQIDNLQLLCPNCHSQTPNFRGKNINNGAKKVSDEELLVAIGSSKNIRQTLLRVGLTPKGGNYTRVQEMMTKHNLVFKK